MDRFSKNAFIEFASDPSNLEELELDLQSEVERRLHPLVKAEMEKIVDELNARGHELRYRCEPAPGDIHFRDWRPGHCDLLLACDTVITSTFRRAIEE